ncbi:hypothetical protein QTP86_026064 [Hemibagrus guttatus]|nr:hypothetical protein QTP86_026064 [Hemibagrus guttatus]
MIRYIRAPSGILPELSSCIANLSDTSVLPHTLKRWIMSVEGVSSLLMTSSSGRSFTVPVEHLDYSYIQQCGDLKYLEKILHVLRSGTEGAYPHLTDFCEKRIETLDPRHRALRKDTCPATAASFSTDEWKHITDDLQAWQREIAEREQQLIQSPIFSSDTLPPVHNRTLQNYSQRPTNSTATTPRGKQYAVPRAYSDWDRFDVDKECAKVDEAINNYDAPAMINTHTHLTHHIDNSALTQQEKCVLSTREREKGNEAFRARDWHEAIVYYTRSLCILTTVAGYNNRAQAEIKLQRWNDALSDCDAVLCIETHNCKALLRRATVYIHLGNLQAAHKDITSVLYSDPHNITAQKLLQEVNKKINTELLHNTYTPNQPVRGKKLLIQEVDEEEDKETSCETDAESAGGDKHAQRETEEQTDGEMERQTERRTDGDRQRVDVTAVRSEGNELYMKGQYGDAEEKYTYGITTLTQLGLYSKDDMFVLYCNRAACFLKMGQCFECVSDCYRALHLKPFSVKALLRRAMAFETLEKFRLAYVDYRTVQQIHNTHSVQQHVNRVTKVLMDQDGSDWRTKLPEIPFVPMSAQHDGTETLPTSQTTPITHTVPTMKTPPNTETLPTRKILPTKQSPTTVEILLQTEAPPTGAPSHTRRHINIVEVESDVTDDGYDDEDGDDKGDKNRNEDGAATDDDGDKDEDGADADGDKDEDGADDDGDKDEDGADDDGDKDEDGADDDGDKDEDGADDDGDKDEDGADDDGDKDEDGADDDGDKDEDGADDDGDKDEDGADDDGDKDEDGADADGDEGDVAYIKTSSSANAFEFGQALNAARCRGDLAASARLLRSVSPQTLPQHISTHLDTHTLSFITHTLYKHILPTEPGLVYLLLTHLHTINRFTEEEEEDEGGAVFNLDVLVSLLREENAVDICVIRVPDEPKYTEFFIIVSGSSTRHLRAMSQYTIAVYKFLRRDSDPHTHIEGQDCDDWMCIDFAPGCTMGRRRAGGGSVLLWSMFCWETLGPAVHVDVIVTRSTYLSIVADHVHPFMETLFPDGCGLFQQDNAPCHKAEMVQEWFDDHNNQFEVLTPPPHSPDLNPIQHLWYVLDKQVRSMEAPPHNLQDLKDLLLTSWCQIPQHTFRDLVESMPRRVRTVVWHKGDQHNIMQDRLIGGVRGPRGVMDQDIVQVGNGEGSVRPENDVHEALERSWGAVDHVTASGYLVA